MTAESQWLNVQDIAELLQVKDETVRRWIRRRELPVLELGGPRAGYRVRRDDLDHFIWQRYSMRDQNDSGREAHAGSTSAPDDAETRALTPEPDAQQHSPYISLMRRIPGITYIISADLKTGEDVRQIAFISEEFERLLGGTVTHLREGDRAWWEQVHPEDRARVQASRLHSFRTGERLSIEYRILAPGGDQVWVRDEAVMGDDTGSGQPVWQGIVSNIADRKRVEDALQARVRQQEAVAELGEHALQQIDVRALLNEAVQYVSQTLGTPLVMILELQPGGDKLILRAGAGWRPGMVGRATVSAGADSPAGYTLSSNEPVIVTDLLQETRFSTPPLLRDHGVRSGVSAIIAGHGKPFGIIGANTTSLRQFAVDDVHFLQSVANVIASATMAAAQRPDGSRWLSIRDVACTLRVKEETVRRWIRRGEMPIVDLGSSRAGYRIHPADLEQFINERYMKP